MPSKPIIALLALVVACVFAAAGCQSATAPDSVITRYGANDPQAQLDYWHTVATRPLINNDDAFHGVLLYIDGKDDAQNYQQRVAALKSHGYLPAGFNQPANQALQRGTLAVALAKFLGIKGGLTMRVLGPTPHYAMRELEYRGVYPPSSTNQIFTGAEFVGVIGKAQDFRQGDPTDLPAATVPTLAEQQSDDLITPILAMIAPEAPQLTLSPTTAATTRTTGPIQITITAVEGLASVRTDENSPWQPAVKGMVVGEQAEFRTGPRGTVQFIIPPGQTVSVDRLTTLKVLKAIEQGGKVTTDLGIKYGRTRYDLEGGGLEHQSTLRSPNSTLAVRGTKVSLFDQPPFAPQATSLTGRAEFRAYRRRTIAFGNRGQGKTVVTDTSTTAGDLALNATVVDPTLQGARTESEAVLLTTLVSRGATVSIDRESGIKIVRGGVPPTDAQLTSALPGRLNFVLRWNSDANLDFGVSTPATDLNPGGEFVYPAAGLNLAPSGGKTAFDHRGGANGGIEVIYFDKVIDGSYALGGRNITPGTVTTATLDAFLNGQKIQLFDGLQQVDTTTQTVTPQQPALGLVFVNTPPPVIPMFKRAAPKQPVQIMGPVPRGVNAVKK